MSGPEFSKEPKDRLNYTRRFDSFYTRFAKAYGLLLDLFPLWHRWIGQALPFVVGPRVLEVSFGTGHLMARYAGRYRTYGLDLNRALVRQAADRLRRKGLSVQLQVADVVELPYAAGTFDSLLNTMAFSGYPEGARALQEMRRVLKPGGKLAMVDVNYPLDGNRLGMALAWIWKASGDLLRDIPRLFQEIGWHCEDREVGGFGSVHLYLAEKPVNLEPQDPG